MTLKESQNLVKTLREVFDHVLIVDPFSHQIYDYVEKGKLEPIFEC